MCSWGIRMNYFDKARTGGIYTKHGRKAQKTLMDRRHTQNIHARPTHIQHTDGRHIKHARTEGIQHTINVLIPDSARRPENSDNYSCAREARSNFNIFLGRNLSSFVFCVSNFVFQSADSHGNIRFSGKTAIYADFS